MNRLPMSFDEARDAVTSLMEGKYKTDKERATYLEGLKLGIIIGRPLQDDAEVETFLKAINLHLKLYGK